MVQPAEANRPGWQPELFGPCAGSLGAGDADWRVYPNPAGRQLTIEKAGGGTFDLLDVNGRTLQTIIVPPAGPARTSLLRYPAGTYLLRERSTGATQKVLIQQP